MRNINILPTLHIKYFYTEFSLNFNLILKRDKQHLHG